MSKLELKHIAPYLPYGVKVYDSNAYPVCGFFELNHNGGTGRIAISELSASPKLYKIALRPMSDLDTDDDAWYQKKTSIEYAIEFNSVIHDLDYSTVQLMIANHFDVFGLIDQGLAVDINHL